MSRARRAVLGLAVALLAACVVSVPAASAADIVLPFTNYKVGGSLHREEARPVDHAAGRIDLQRQREPHDQRSCRGNVFIPEFTSTIRVLGVPTKVTTKLDEAQPVQGTIALDSTGVHIRSTTLGDPEDQEAATRPAQRADNLPHGRAGPAHARTTTGR